jgi:hypothetical protein
MSVTGKQSDEAIQNFVRAMKSFAPFAVTDGKNERKKKEAERRQAQCCMMPCQRARPRPPPHPPPRAREERVGAARLSAFHHGACGSERTPPLSPSYALPGTGLEQFTA